MNELLRQLTTGEHAVQVSLRPERSVGRLREAVSRGYVHVNFTGTRGGTELGVTLDRSRSDLRRLDHGDIAGDILIVGGLTLDYVPVSCVARIDLATLEGRGFLETATVDTGC